MGEKKDGAAGLEGANVGACVGVGVGVGVAVVVVGKVKGAGLKGVVDGNVTLGNVVCEVNIEELAV